MRISPVVAGRSQKKLCFALVLEPGLRSDLGAGRRQGTPRRGATQRVSFGGGEGCVRSGEGVSRAPAGLRCSPGMGVPGGRGRLRLCELSWSSTGRVSTGHSGEDGRPVPTPTAAATAVLRVGPGPRAPLGAVPGGGCPGAGGSPGAGCCPGAAGCRRQSSRGGRRGGHRARGTFPDALRGLTRFSRFFL